MDKIFDAVALLVNGLEAQIIWLRRAKGSARWQRLEKSDERNIISALKAQLN